MKVIGLVLLLACTFGITQVACKAEQEAYRKCEAFLDLIRYVNLQIQQYAMPLSEIYEAWNGNIDFGTFDKMLKSKGLDAALNQGSTLGVPKKLLSCLRNLSEKLGQGDSTAQNEILSRCDRDIALICEELKKSMPERLKIKRTLGIAIALTVAILIL